MTDELLPLSTAENIYDTWMIAIEERTIQPDLMKQ
jgi:hypothetical protein